MERPVLIGPASGGHFGIALLLVGIGMTLNLR